MPESDEFPFDRIRPLAVLEVEEAPGLRHVEAFTAKGLFSALWHGDPDATTVVAAVGGALGGTLGPGRGLYPELGRTLAAEGVGLLRVGYRRPNDLDACTLDLCAALDLAWRRGARTFVTLGHSFGGAIAIRAAASVPAVAGVVTYATQSAGCEVAEHLEGRPLLLFHGDADQILPPFSSEAVRFMAGSGDLVLLPGGDHLLAAEHDLLLERTLAFVREVTSAA